MEKYSVKKPFTVLVAVLIVFLMGFVSVTNLRTDLLPEMSTPYLMVVTVYPGASPEKVEAEVSEVLESALGTVAGVSSITSTSAENYSIVQLGFAADTDMNSAMVKVSNTLDQNADSLPDICLTPPILELSMDMSSLMTVAVGREGADIYELSDFLEESVIPELERQEGVSSISTTGLINQYIQVQLNEEKIDALNVLLLEQVDTQLALAKEQLDAAAKQLADGRAQLQQAIDTFGNVFASGVVERVAGMVSEATEEIRGKVQTLMNAIDNLIAFVNEPEIQAALVSVRDGLGEIMDEIASTGLRDIDDLIDVVSKIRDLTDELTVALQQLQQRLDQETGGDGSTAGDLMDTLQIQESLNVVYSTMEDVLDSLNRVPELLDQFETVYAEMSQTQLEAYLQITEAQRQVDEGQKLYDQYEEEYEQAKSSAFANADVNNLLTIDILSQLIYAQNFSMPAGYIDDKDDNSWLLKVGEEYDSIEDLEGALLLHIEGVTDVYLSDVADVAVVDNAAASFTRLNGEQAVVMNIYKSTSASANAVSDACLAAFDSLEGRYEGLNFSVLSNQGNYITILISSILSSMAQGAVLDPGAVPEGRQAHPGGRRQHPPVGAVCRGHDVFHRPRPEHHEPGRPVSGHRHAGGQLHRRHRKHLPPAGPGRPRPPRGGAGHPAGLCLHRVLYPDLGLRLFPGGVYQAGDPGADAAHVPDHRLLPDGLPDRGHHGGARFGLHRPEKRRGQKMALV